MAILSSLRELLLSYHFINEAYQGHASAFLSSSGISSFEREQSKFGGGGIIAIRHPSKGTELELFRGKPRIGFQSDRDDMKIIKIDDQLHGRKSSILQNFMHGSVKHWI